MIVKLARGRKGRYAVAIVAAAFAVDLVVGPLLIAHVTVPLLEEVVRRDPSLAGMVEWALSIIP